ncbi:MAG: RIP metalloprotease RseP [Gemmatimonadaceae bacterium]|jgi:regulator of sigma E protease
MIAQLSPYIAPVLVFGLVVFVHELGHFVAAKLMGVYAPVFSLGWGRRLFGWRRGETDYRVSLIPLGGYVRMATREDETMAGIEGGAERGSLEASTDRPEDVSAALWDAEGMAPFGPRPVPASRWVESKSVPARVFILSAGVIMNILLTLAVSSGVFAVYGRGVRPAVLDSVMAGSPAAVAGLQAGDHITMVNGTAVRSWDEVVERVMPVTSGTVTLGFERAGQMQSVAVTPQAIDVVDPESGQNRRVGRVGMFVRDSVARTAVGAIEAVQLGGRATWGMATNVFGVLRGLMAGEVSAKNLGGPIQIARTSVQAAKRGAETLWSLIAFLSLNIAILNLVPIPVLDGGQILLVLAEKIKGRAFSSRTREAFARVGVAAVFALILLVTFNDLRATFGR